VPVRTARAGVVQRVGVALRDAAIRWRSALLRRRELRHRQLRPQRRVGAALSEAERLSLSRLASHLVPLHRPGVAAEPALGSDALRELTGGGAVREREHLVLSRRLFDSC
jgi:hypothetical protein